MGLYYSQKAKREKDQQNMLADSLSPSYSGQALKDTPVTVNEKAIPQPDPNPQGLPETMQQPTETMQKEDFSTKSNNRGVIKDINPQTGEEVYFADSPVTNFRAKKWDDMNRLEKFVASGDTAGEIGRSLSGNVVLGGGSQLLAAAGGIGRQMETMNPAALASKSADELAKRFGIEMPEKIKKIQDMVGEKRTGSQVLMDWSNAVSEYKEKEFPTATYDQEDITIENIPKLLINPEFVLNSLSSMVTTGLIWKAGGMAGLYGLESGGLLTEKRAKALREGAQEETTGEIIYSMGMGLFNAWIENLSFNVMSGTTKVPLTEALLDKISNNMVKNITSWGVRTATEMGEEFIQEGLPILVSAALFKEKDGIKNAFERVKEAFPGAIKQGESAAIMALPGAGLLSGVGVASESNMKTQQKASQLTEAKVDTKVADIRGRLLSEAKTIEVNSGEGTLIKDGKLAQSFVDTRSFDVAEKMKVFLGEEVGNKIASELKKGEYSSAEDFVTKAEQLMVENAPKADKAIYQNFVEQSKAKNQSKLDSRGTLVEPNAKTTTYENEKMNLENLGEKQLQIYSEHNKAIQKISENGKNALVEAELSPEVIEFGNPEQIKEFAKAELEKTGNGEKTVASEMEEFSKDKAVILDYQDGKLVAIDGNHHLFNNKMKGESKVKVLMTEEAFQQSQEGGVESVQTGETKAEGTSIVREDLKAIYKIAEKEDVADTLQKSITKKLTQQELDKLTDNQKAVMTTALGGIVDSSGGTASSAAIQNLSALKGSSEVVLDTTGEKSPASTEGANGLQASIPAKVIGSVGDESARILAMDTNIENAKAGRKASLLTARDNMRAKIQEDIKKDAVTFVDLANGKNKASSLTLSVKKLPNKKYGYAATLNTPQKSYSRSYAPKFTSSAQASRMGIQGAIRMIETARADGAPVAGLTKMRNAVMKANTKLGKNKLSAEKIKKIAKETKKQVKNSKKPKKKTTPVKKTKKVEKISQKKKDAIKIIKSYQKHIGKFKHIETPELIKLAKELTGASPVVKKLRQGLHGYFRPTTLQIGLTTDLFKDEKAVAQTLAHEIGHLTDYLPDKTMARGNLLGRIGTLRGFLRHTFTNPKTELEITDLLTERNKLVIERREARAKNNESLSKSLLKKIKALNVKIKNLQKGGVMKEEVFNELWELSKKWRPLGENNSPSFLQYRRSSEELYADALSVMFNDPSLLEKEAPIFYSLFLKNLDQKPKVKQLLFDTWELINNGEKAIYAERKRGIYEMFQKGEDVMAIKRMEANEKENDMVFRLKRELFNENQIMYDKVKKAKKEGKVISDDSNPIYWLEEHNYLGGKIKAYVEQKINPIYQRLNENEISWEDFGAVLLLERSIDERGEMANPGGFAPKTATAQLKGMKEDLGKEKFDILTEEVNNFRAITQEVLGKAEESGLYTPELMEKMKANKSYATFQVIDYIQSAEYIPASIRQQVGTLSDVTNPATSTVMKTISILRAAETNNTKRAVVEFLKETESEEVQDAKTTYTGKYHKPVPPNDKNKGLWTVLENGKLKGYYIDKYAAEMMKGMSQQTINGFLLPTLRVLNKKIFRPTFIQYNVGFMAFNKARDFWRFWKNIPGMSLARTYLLFQKEAKPIVKSYLKGNIEPVILEMQEKGMLSFTYSEMISGQESLDTQIEHTLEKTGITPLTPKKNIKALAPFIKILDYVDEVGQTIEMIPKVAGYLNFKEKGSPFEDKELGQFIRTSVGSPDFLRKGAGYVWTNEVFLFSNAIKEAIVSDAKVMVNPKTRNSFWMKTAAANLAPKLLMAAAVAGLFGEPLKEMFDDMSEYDKTNYICVPLGVDKNGKTLYLRIPQDETGRFISGVAWKMLTAGQNAKPIASDLFDLFSYAGGQLPGVSPAIKTVVATGQFAMGNNPYDSYRGRPAIPEEQFTAGGKYALKPFLLWSLQNMGASVLLRMNITEQTPTEKGIAEKSLELPLVSNLVGRFLRVSDYGQIEKARAVGEEVDKENSQRRIKWKTEINDAVGVYQKGDKTEASKNILENKLVAKLLKGEVNKTQESYIRKKFQDGILTGESDAKTKAIMSTYSNEAKIRVLNDYKEGMTPVEFSTFISGLYADKIISKTVFNQFN